MIVNALKSLYVSAGGNASDVAGKETIAEVLKVFSDAHFGANELPEVTADDNGKMAKVVNGDWDKVAFPAVYKPAGDKEVTDLTDALLNVGNLGNVYNCTTSGTTTNDFVGGSGKTINVGDNVAVVDVGTAEEPSYKFDLLSGMVDTSTLQPKTLATPLNIGGQSQTTVEDALGALATSGGGNSHIFDDSEKVVGTWTDGKPIYEKTISGLDGPIANTWHAKKVTALSGIHIDKVWMDVGQSFWNFNGSTSTADGNFNFNAQHPLNTVYYYVTPFKANNTDDIYIETYSNNGSWSGGSMTITFRYTKTTDPTPNN